ncbi:hypothetical protein PTI98_009092 [Pleurotus ostreatus]|nr:hypothetical protein PTI98_009092 [Pleurotus ostreatus]
MRAETSEAPGPHALALLFLLFALMPVTCSNCPKLDIQKAHGLKTRFNKYHEAQGVHIIEQPGFEMPVGDAAPVLRTRPRPHRIALEGQDACLNVLATWTERRE